RPRARLPPDRRPGGRRGAPVLRDVRTAAARAGDAPLVRGLHAGAVAGREAWVRAVARPCAAHGLGPRRRVPPVPRTGRAGGAARDRRRPRPLGPVTGKATRAEHLRELARLRRVRDRIDREYAQPLDVEALARGEHVSAGHLSRQFRLAYG